MIRLIKNKDTLLLSAVGLIPVIWIALLAAPYASGSVFEMISNMDKMFEEPYRIRLVEGSLRTVLLFVTAYVLGIGIYLSMQKNFRRGEEHGSAKWGDASYVNSKYASKLYTNNKLLTRNVRIGLDGRTHMRNLNVLVIGGSGSGKTRFYCKPNILQANTSFVVLDPKGETNYSHFFYIFSKERRYVKWLNFKVSRLQPYMKGFPKTMSCKVKVIVF